MYFKGGVVIRDIRAIKPSFTGVAIEKEERVSSVVEHLSANQRSPVRFRARVMDYDEACFMHLTPGVVHNFPKAVGV